MLPSRWLVYLAGTVLCIASAVSGERYRTVLYCTGSKPSSGKPYTASPSVSTLPSTRSFPLLAPGSARLHLFLSIFTVVLND